MFSFLFRDVDYNNLNKLVSKSFVIAYLTQEVPRYVIKHAYEVLPRALDIADSDLNFDLLNFNNTNPLNHIMINGSNVNEINSGITLKTIENMDHKSVTNKDSLKFTINENLVENEVLH